MQESCHRLLTEVSTTVLPFVVPVLAHRGEQAQQRCGVGEDAHHLARLSNLLGQSDQCYIVGESRVRRSLVRSKAGSADWDRRPPTKAPADELNSRFCLTTRHPPQVVHLLEAAVRPRAIASSGVTVGGNTHPAA